MRGAFVLRCRCHPGAPPTRGELLNIFETALSLKRARSQWRDWQPLHGRHVALLAPRRDAAARALDHAVDALGAKLVWLDSEAWLRGAAARVPEAARLLGQLYDAVDGCGLPRDVLEGIEQHAQIPVLCALARDEPTDHVLAAWLTLREVHGRPLDGLALRLCGDAHSPAYEVALELARLSGVAIQPAHSAAAVDAVLDTAAKPVPTLSMPRLPKAEQARLAPLQRDNRQVLVQSLLMDAMA